MFLKNYNKGSLNEVCLENCVSAESVLERRQGPVWVIKVSFLKREHLGWALKDEQDLTKSINMVLCSRPSARHSQDRQLITSDQVREELGE